MSASKDILKWIKSGGKCGRTLQYCPIRKMYLAIHHGTTPVTGKNITEIVDSLKQIGQIQKKGNKV